MTRNRRWFVEHYATHRAKDCAQCDEGFVTNLLGMGRVDVPGIEGGGICSVCEEPAHYEEFGKPYCLTHALLASI